MIKINLYCAVLCKSNYEHKLSCLVWFAINSATSLSSQDYINAEGLHRTLQMKYVFNRSQSYFDVKVVIYINSLMNIKFVELNVNINSFHASDAKSCPITLIS